ncbi:MAG: T9SS type A sorting domain-containing protein [Bacteroidetes bacterium]|nr:T9SS type A sorting domain-containing protein [Bacteroidota bacterium]
MIKKFLLIYFLICLFRASSQDIKISYMQIGWLHGYTFSDTTFLLIDPSTNVNRPYILVDWGVKIDTSKLVQTKVLNNGILKKYYGTCSYPGVGNYMIKYQDKFRIANIKNIAQSDNQSIKLTNLLNIQTFGIPFYTSPILQNSDIDLVVQGSNIVFKPQFYDLENDSLSYQLTSCFASNYYTPTGVTLDAYGNLSFSKDSLGIYAFSMLVKEWRKNDDQDYVFIQSSQIDFTINTTTDVFVQGLKNELSFKLYPNPTNSILNISNEQNQLQNSTIQIKNPLGQIVYSSPFRNQIDISLLSSGIYFLTIEDRSNKKTVKIIKND